MQCNPYSHGQVLLSGNITETGGSNFVIFRDGKHWDALYYGLLQSEWESREQEALGL